MLFTQTEKKKRSRRSSLSRRKYFKKLREELKTEREREYVVKVMTINHSWRSISVLSTFTFSPWTSLHKNNELKSQFKPQSRRNIDVFENYIDSSICWMFLGSREKMKNYVRSEEKNSSINNHKKSILFWMSARRRSHFEWKAMTLLSVSCVSHTQYNFDHSIKQQ